MHNKFESFTSPFLSTFISIRCSICYLVIKNERIQVTETEFHKRFHKAFSVLLTVSRCFCLMTR